MNKVLSEYIIPKNVKTRFEFFPGYGWRELFITMFGLLIGYLFYRLLGIFTTSPFRLFIIVLFGSLAVAISLSDPRTGKNIIDFYKDYKRFNSHPKRYIYKFGEGRDKYVQ